MLARILPRLITWLISIAQSASLRDQVYLQRERIEILETALDDIQRISSSRSTVSERHRLIMGIISNTMPRK